MPFEAAIKSLDRKEAPSVQGEKVFEEKTAEGFSPQASRMSYKVKFERTEGKGWSFSTSPVGGLV